MYMMYMPLMMYSVEERLPTTEPTGCLCLSVANPPNPSLSGANIPLQASVACLLLIYSQTSEQFREQQLTTGHFGFMFHDMIFINMIYLYLCVNCFPVFCPAASDPLQMARTARHVAQVYPSTAATHAPTPASVHVQQEKMSQLNDWEAVPPQHAMASDLLMSWVCTNQREASETFYSWKTQNNQYPFGTGG